MAAETIIFYAMPLWQRGGLIVMGFIMLAVAYRLWRTPINVDVITGTMIRNNPTILPVFKLACESTGGRRFLASLMALFGATTLLVAAIGETVALEPGGLRCAGHGVIPLGEVRSAVTTTYKEGGGWFISPSHHTGLALVPPAGYSTICRQFDYLDEASRARLLALVRERIAAQPRR